MIESAGLSSKVRPRLFVQSASAAGALDMVVRSQVGPRLRHQGRQPSDHADLLTTARKFGDPSD
jgi:hypothetical protein